MSSDSSDKEKKWLQSYSPDLILFLGALMVVLAYLLYPLKAISMLPGILIGGGMVGLTWIAFKVLQLSSKK